jgi:Probable cobalt transporter subunit (CbtB)
MTAVRSTVGKTGALAPWVWPVLAVALGMLYAVTFDNGFISSKVSSSAMYLHELFHDGRHLLGVPCH